MTVVTKTRLDVVPLTRHIGAEIRGFDLREKPDDPWTSAVFYDVPGGGRYLHFGVRATPRVEVAS